MNIFYAQYSTGEVAEKLAVPSYTIQAWVKRGIVTAQPSEIPEFPGASGAITGGGTPGNHRRFSFFSVMEIAIAKAFIDAGVTNLELIFRAAGAFAHTGRGEALNDQPPRIPGCPFRALDPNQTTVVGIHGERTVVMTWNPVSDSTYRLHAALGAEEGAIFVDAGAIFRKVVTTLGYDPKEVLALAYGKSAG